jgi:hypothetical protein
VARSRVDDARLAAFCAEIVGATGAPATFAHTMYNAVTLQSPSSLQDVPTASALALASPAAAAAPQPSAVRPGAADAAGANEAAKSLAQLDEMKTGWFHIKAVIVAGMGFFTDAYDRDRPNSAEHHGAHDAHLGAAQHRAGDEDHWPRVLSGPALPESGTVSRG